jgi:hypothetical protein
MTVYDLINNPNIGLGAIHVMLTRSRIPDGITIHTGNLRSKYDWAKQIKFHMMEDMKKKRRWKEGEYITPANVEGKLIKQKFKCEICKDILENPSINRWDNSQAHTAANCNMCCLNCNKKMQDKPRSF